MDKPRILFTIYPGTDDEPTRRRRGLFVIEELRKLGWMVSEQDDAADIVVIQRIATPEQVRKYQASGRLVIFDQNDALLHRGTMFHRPTERETVSQADVVVVTCRYMQQMYARVNPRTVMIPDALEDEFWATPLPEIPKSPLVLSWVGMPDNLQYIEPCVEWLAGIADLRLKIITSEVDSKGRSNRERVGGWPVPTEFVVWQRDTFVYELAGAHAGIVALPDTSFCRGKAQHKVIGFSALSLACIASNMPGYREVITHGENGLLAETPEQWQEAIEVIRDPSVRQNLGANARAMSQYFTRQAIGANWDRLLQQAWRVKEGEAA